MTCTPIFMLSYVGIMDKEEVYVPGDIFLVY
jgi:hypothetical protein